MVAAEAAIGVTDTRYNTVKTRAIEVTTAIPFKALNRLKATLNRPGFDGVGFNIGFWCVFGFGTTVFGGTFVGFSCFYTDIAKASASTKTRLLT